MHCYKLNHEHCEIVPVSGFAPALLSERAIMRDQCSCSSQLVSDALHEQVDQCYFGLPLHATIAILSFTK